jgi:hypothetical protein
MPLQLHSRTTPKNTFANIKKLQKIDELIFFILKIRERV